MKRESKDKFQEGQITQPISLIAKYWQKKKQTKGVLIMSQLSLSLGQRSNITSGVWLRTEFTTRGRIH